MEMELYAHLVGRTTQAEEPHTWSWSPIARTSTPALRNLQPLKAPRRIAVKMTTRAQLRDELANRTTGGIYFTTLQKFGLTKGERDSGLIIRLPTGATSSSWSTKPTVVTTTTSTATPATSVTRCPMRRSSPSPGRRSPSPTAIPAMYSAPYIDVYDLTRAVDDGATVPVFFEPRLIKVGSQRASPKKTSTRPPTR